jgi:1,4-dihydroxy-2-naphthoate octaprenyltransferase
MPSSSTLASLPRLIRAPFLVLTPICVGVGAAAAWHDIGSIPVARLLIILIGALAAHISVNVFNEYFDFRSGLDLKTNRTPFSGGSGALPDDPSLLNTAYALAWGSFGVTVLCGILLLRAAGPGLLPIGLAGLALIYLYTNWINRSPWLCLIAPGAGFGLFMVTGSYYALTGQFSTTAIAAALPVFFLTNALLLLNQLPDIEADRSVGRRHLPIVLGVERSLHIFSALLILAYGSVVAAVLLGILPNAALTVLLTIPLAFVIRKRLGSGETTELADLIPALGQNVALTLATPLLLGVGLFVSGWLTP